MSDTAPKSSVQQVSKNSSIPGGIQGLKQYVKLVPERNTPPYYAGRKEILSNIEDTCELIWQQHRKQAPQTKGETRLIYGAPGAGKSSTLMHLRDVWRQNQFATNNRDGSARAGPAPVMMYFGAANSINSIVKFCEILVDTVAPERREELPKSIRKSVRKSGGFHFGFGKGHIESERTIELDLAKTGLHAVANVLRPGDWTRPVVIGIDEAQTLTGDVHSPQGILLTTLHANDLDLPVLVVLGGLSDSIKQVGQSGLTRLKHGCVHSLDCLTDSELEELKLGFCEHFDINLGPHAKQFDALVKRTDGWPIHIQNTLHAFSQVYLSVDGDIGKVDFVEVERLSQGARNWYYRFRMSSEINDTVLLLAAIMTEMEQPITRLQVLALIEKLRRKDEFVAGTGEHIPKGMTVKSYYDHLIHRGALQERDSGLVECPIPSFRQFLMAYPHLHKIQSPQRDVPHHHAVQPNLSDLFPTNEDYLRWLH